MQKDIVVGKCYLHLGSNQEDPMVQLARAIQMIEESIGPILSSSSYYKTAAWGNTDQPYFINIALEVEHYKTPTALLKTVNQIEDQLGRIRIEKWGPRLIDIDILLMEDIIMDTDNLTIPHRLMQDRHFVLYPMVELAPELYHPVFQKTMKELLEECNDESAIEKLTLRF